MQTGSPNVDVDHPELHASHVSILEPILRSLATSQKVKLVFCPTLAVLRGYLSAYNAHNITQRGCLSDAKTQLIVLDLLALHHGTSEFSLQGLSRTLAAAVSAAYHSEADLKLVECKNIHDPTDPNRGPTLWDAEIALLNRSVKLGGEGSRWATRSVSVRKVASRWFAFEEQPVENPSEKQ